MKREVDAWYQRARDRDFQTWEFHAQDGGLLLIRSYPRSDPTGDHPSVMDFMAVGVGYMELPRFLSGGIDFDKPTEKEVARATAQMGGSLGGRTVRIVKNRGSRFLIAASRFKAQEKLDPNQLFSPFVGPARRYEPTTVPPSGKTPSSRQRQTTGDWRQQAKTRDFLLWNYAVGHGEMSLRSPKGGGAVDGAKTDLDLLVIDTLYFELPRELVGGIAFVQPTDEELQRAERAVERSLGKYLLRAIETRSGRYLVAAWAFGEAESNPVPFDPRNPQSASRARAERPTQWEYGPSS